MHPLLSRLSGWLVALAASAPLLAAAPSVVKIVDDGQGHYGLTLDGAPYVIHGVGGENHLEEARALGVTTIRTWGADQLDKQVDGKTLSERCQSLGLHIMAGIWVGQERQGFNYNDPAQVQRQRDMVRDVVRRHKDDPAILIWGLGNEMEGSGHDVRIWGELDRLAQIIHEEDPNHPVCTVLAGATVDKIQSLMANYPHLDIVGINAYASAPGVGKTLRDAGWKKPFLLTEFGPVGQWEVPKTSWGAPIEPTSREKAEHYYVSATTVMDDGQGRCLGSFAFLWGHKQETTFTWYGMFLPTGEKLPSVDAMSYVWTGHWPADRSPRINSLTASFKEQKVDASTPETVTCAAKDAQNYPLTYEWLVISESTDRREGGDTERAPPVIPGCIIDGSGPTLQMRAPAQPGAYRVFCIVRNGHGGASADNFPFLIQ